MNGFIHSVESFGTVDGPGIRFVIFLQGCPLRCKYCHNPDTWNLKGGTEMSAYELIKQYEKNKYFYSNGGITVTGGEPLLQIDFLLELFTLAKEKKIHTCIDTSGVTYNEKESEYNKKLEKLLALTDLVMLDIKHMDSQAHFELTGVKNERILSFAKYLDEKNIPVWIRHVVVPDITDREQDLSALGSFIGTLKNVKALDVLPYHTMGIEKYRELSIPYPLQGVQGTTAEQANAAKQVILNAFYEYRKTLKN